jgi:hypothetical protein
MARPPIKRKTQATFSTRVEARAAIFEWIKDFYNCEWFHSASPRYQSPVDFENQIN